MPEYQHFLSTPVTRGHTPYTSDDSSDSLSSSSSGDVASLETIRERSSSSSDDMSYRSSDGEDTSTSQVNLCLNDAFLQDASAVGDVQGSASFDREEFPESQENTFNFLRLSDFRNDQTVEVAQRSKLFDTSSPKEDGVFRFETGDAAFYPLREPRRLFSQTGNHVTTSRCQTNMGTPCCYKLQPSAYVHRRGKLTFLDRDTGFYNDDLSLQGTSSVICENKKCLEKRGRKLLTLRHSTNNMYESTLELLSSKEKLRSKCVHLPNIVIKKQRVDSGELDTLDTERQGVSPVYSDEPMQEQDVVGAGNADSKSSSFSNILQSKYCQTPQKKPRGLHVDTAQQLHSPPITPKTPMAQKTPKTPTILSTNKTPRTPKTPLTPATKTTRFQLPPPLMRLKDNTALSVTSPHFLQAKHNVHDTASPASSRSFNFRSPSVDFRQKRIDESKISMKMSLPCRYVSKISMQIVIDTYI